MKPTKAATFAARGAGFLTLGWVLYAIFDLHWLLHMRKIHYLFTKAPLEFAYVPYLACSILNLVAAVILTIILFAIPGPFLRWLTPAAGKRMPWSGGLVASIVAIGLAVFAWGLYMVLSTAMLAIFTTGKLPNWQIVLCGYLFASVAGILVCRLALNGRREEW